MELLAVIVALESIKRPELPVVIHSDSQYVINSIEKGWLWGWVKKGFKGKKNADLWQRFIPAYKRVNDVKLKWVKGHAGIPENERADELATLAADHPPHLIDAGFEQEANTLL